VTHSLRIASDHVVRALDGGYSLDEALGELRATYEAHVSRDGFAETCWSIDDVTDRRAAWTEERTRDWLTRYSGLIQDAMVEAGWEAIDALLEE